MHTVEYRIWGPKASPFCVEFPANLMRDLGIAEDSGALYGSRNGGEVRIAAIRTPQGEEEKKIGVFFSRIRGEVFLTETDLEFFNEHESEVALVVAGDRAGFFVREADGSIQTVRSHEEFSVAAQPLDASAADSFASTAIATPPGEPRPALQRMRTWAPGLAMLAALPIAALAVFPQRVPPAPSALQVRETGGQLRISWKPGENAVLAIEDGGSKLAVPVYANHSSVTYAPRGPQVAVSLVTIDAANQPRRETALYISARH
jgi:hypothetical protein